MLYNILCFSFPVKKKKAINEWTCLLMPSFVMNSFFWVIITLFSSSGPLQACQFLSSCSHYCLLACLKFCWNSFLFIRCNDVMVKTCRYCEGIPKQSSHVCTSTHILCPGMRNTHACLEAVKPVHKCQCCKISFWNCSGFCKGFFTGMPCSFPVCNH